jgi:hypothetical protein
MEGMVTLGISQRSLDITPCKIHITIGINKKFFI